MKIPFIKPNPPALSQHVDRLERLEASGLYSNFGPENQRFEKAFVDGFFAGQGVALTVCNATLGLMIAVKEAITRNGRNRAKYALMPSFTFAATGHAADWCGLTPLFCDIDEKTWLPCAESEERLLREYAGDVAVILPYATFGKPLDMGRYDALSRQTGIPVVVDAAASLGACDAEGRNFGYSGDATFVYSMHVTKAFATSEGGVIYSADPGRIARMRAMSNYGFTEPRTATLAGLNAKMSELAALAANLKLESFASGAEHRIQLAQRYRHNLGQCEVQGGQASDCAWQFFSVLLPRDSAGRRAEILRALGGRGIGAACYFSPHLAEQPYFKTMGPETDLPVTEDVSSRILSLPLHEFLSFQDVDEVCAALLAEIAAHAVPLARRRV